MTRWKKPNGYQGRYKPKVSTRSILRYNKLIDHVKECDHISLQNLKKFVADNNTDNIEKVYTNTETWKIIRGGSGPEPHIVTEGLRFRSLSDSPFNVQVSDDGGTAPAGITGLCYSLDEGATWTPYSLDGGDISVPAGSFIEWRADSWLLSPEDDSVMFMFDITDIKVEGDLTWLCGHSSTLPEGTCFISLFYGDGIQDASALYLPSNTVDSCYRYMFGDSSSLTSAPALPALILTNECYNNMFGGCSSLISAPALPATTLADYCYYEMFKDCTSLVNAPALPATTLADSCYYMMFFECTSLTTAPTLPSITLAPACYRGMFTKCSSLTSAPALPATILAPRCYDTMFFECTSLTEVTIHASDTSAVNCLDAWLSDTTSGGTVHCKSSFSEIFITPYGWTKDGTL